MSRRSRLRALVLAVATWIAGPLAAEQPKRIVVLPVQDLTGVSAPREFVDQRVRERLTEWGFEVVEPDRVLEFLRAGRVRYTGGASERTLAGLRRDLGADGVVAGSIDLYVEEGFPRSGVTLRMIATNDARILGAGERALAGEESPGVLGLHEVFDPGVLLDRTVVEAVDLMVDDMHAPSRARGVWSHSNGQDRYRPKRTYRAAAYDEPRDRPARIAVVPFENPSGRADAGDVLSALFVTHLAGRGKFETVEPGEVRDRLLEGRIIQLEGLSLAQSDLLRELLDVDYAVTGRVLEYFEAGEGIEPRVSFAIWILDTRRREVVWSAYSANRGGDGVVWFDAGRAYSARALASAMAEAAAHDIAHGKPTRTGRRSPPPAEDEDRTP